MKKSGVSVATVTSTNEDGSTLSLDNVSSIEEKSGAVLAYNNEGRQVISLARAVPLKDGSYVPIRYSVDGKSVTARYEKRIKPEDILIRQTATRGAAGCALGALTVVSGAALGAAAIASAPLTGPVGPLAAFGTVTGLGAGIGATGKECTE